MNSDRILPTVVALPSLEGDAYDRLMQLDDVLTSRPSRTDAGSAYDEALDEN